MLGRLKRTVGVMWWMVTYLESSKNIPYMQGSRSRMAAEDGWREAGMGSNVQPLVFRRTGRRISINRW
jgi:hypothetical protein